MFDITKIDDSIVVLNGRFDAAQTGIAEDILADVKTTCTVDFAKLEYISSAGLGVLIATYKRLNKAGFSMKLINMSNHIKDIFHYARLDKIFDIQ